MASSDLVAQWQVPLSDGVHFIEFEHGTTTGKRVIRVNGKVSNANASRFDWVYIARYVPQGVLT